MSLFDDPNREAVGQPPIWTGAGTDVEPQTSRSEPADEETPEPAKPAARKAAAKKG